jgi:salicylate hydroxylase
MPIAEPIFHSAEPLQIAISGAGPAGLAAAIALRQLPGVEVTLYEQATELKEVGAGIRIGYNSWKVLEELGVAEKVYGHAKLVHEHRYVLLYTAETTRLIDDIEMGLRDN